MDTFDLELTERFAALADTTDDSSWLEVRNRARDKARGRRFPRPALLIAAGLALIVLAAAPAVALRGHVVRLFGDAAPAPQRVEESFAAQQEGVPPRTTGVAATHAREVLRTPVAAGETAILWLAPTTGGGFCWILELDKAASHRGAGGECTDRLDRLSVDVSLHGQTTLAGAPLTPPVLIHGWIGLRDADSLELAFQDGDSAEIPLIWVTSPVDTGFFVYSVPERHWSDGHLPTTLTAHAADGDELAHAQITGIRAG